MSEKRDAGKPRLDLIPWADIVTKAEASHTLAEVFQALTAWWVVKPHQLTFAIPERELLGIAAVLGFGAAKYEPRGWEKGIAFSRIFAAAGRHAMALANGEYIDAESGLSHASHFWCNVLFLLVFTARGRADLDDRPTGTPHALATMDQMKALVAQTHGQMPVSAAGLDGGDGKRSN